jgi:hypothetical protein
MAEGLEVDSELKMTGDRSWLLETEDELPA